MTVIEISAPVAAWKVLIFEVCTFARPVYALLGILRLKEPPASMSAAVQTAAAQRLFIPTLAEMPNLSLLCTH